MAKKTARDRRIVEFGDWGTVEYAIRTNGEMEAKEWLEKQSQSIQSSFVHMFRVHANGGRITNEQRFRQLSENIYEYKQRNGNRILAFPHRKSWFLTHYYKKNGPNKCPKRVIKRAEDIRIECLAILQLESGETDENA